MATILIDPRPRTMAVMLDAPTRARLEALGRLVVHEGPGRMPSEGVEAHLPEAVAIVGQTDLDAGRIARAPQLRAVVNVEGNFLPNVDYEACFARGIHVLVASPAFAPAVAEAALGMALDLARGITAADRAMRARTEAYELAANDGCFLLAGSDVGVVGLGDLGRELVRLLAPFGCRVRAYDPWIPELAIEAAGAEPCGLDELLRASRVVFVFAAPTTDNQAMLGRRELELLPEGAALLLMSRAAVADVDALVELAAAGRLRAAIDVWPASRSQPTTPRATSRACCSRRTAPAGCPRPSEPSASSWWQTSSSSSAACPRWPAGARSARRSAACARGRSTGRSERGGAARPGGRGQAARRAPPPAPLHATLWGEP